MSYYLDRAIENLDDENRLFELCRMDSLKVDLKKTALKNPKLAKNQGLLMEIILKENSFFFAEHAIEILLDGKSDEERQGLLFEIVNNAESVDIAYGALKSLRNKDYLEMTALNTRTPGEIRARAIRILYEPIGQSEHEDVFLGDDDWRVRSAIINLGTSDDALIGIVNNDGDNRVRQKALIHIGNDEFLHDFALSGDCLALVFSTINHMENRELLRSVCDSSDDELIRACAQDRIDFLEAKPSALFSF